MANYYDGGLLDGKKKEEVYTARCDCGKSRVNPSWKIVFAWCKRHQRMGHTVHWDYN